MIYSLIIPEATNTQFNFSRLHSPFISRPPDNKFNSSMWDGVNPSRLLSEFIKISKEDSFVFITIVEGEKGFLDWLDKYNLHPYIRFKQEEHLFNIYHTKFANISDYGVKRLKLWVLSANENAVTKMPQAQIDELKSNLGFTNA